MKRDIFLAWGKTPHYSKKGYTFVVKKKKFMQYKKSVGYPKPYHLDKITFNILPNITADILIQTFVLVCVCFFYT